MLGVPHLLFPSRLFYLVIIVSQAIDFQNLQRFCINQILILLDVTKLLSSDDVIHLEQLKELKEKTRVEVQ